MAFTMKTLTGFKKMNIDKKKAKEFWLSRVNDHGQVLNKRKTKRKAVVADKKEAERK